ncbi:hypothetical protein [Sphingomonas sp. VNH70]|uniref:hypothetical protein n=1 Tax=Sphingomonas silueang TaxID=3156617 RepID=UPI0032B5CCEE
MAERRLAMLARCEQALIARRGQAEAAHGHALRAVTGARRTRIEATETLDRVERAWVEQMDEGFDPVRSALFGRMLLAGAADVARAEAAEHAADAASADAARRWRLAEGRCRALATRQAQARRDAVRRREEALLAAQADRLCYRWGRR